MIQNELLQLALAAAIGLLVGIERGWQEREAADGARVAGIRTFTLIGGYGGVAGLLAMHWGGLVLGACLLGFALPFGLFEWRRAHEAGSFSVTDFVAGLVTFLLGALASISMTAAAACGVVTAAILAERKPLHAFLRKLKWVELRAALALLVMTLVLLPALPDRTVDPWNALNPHQIWLMTVMIGAVCYTGYIAMRVAGEHRGLLFAGIMGGFATSTTVTWTFARLARHDPGLRLNVLAAILAAWIISLLRMTAIAVVIAPALLMPLAPPVGAAALLLLLPALVIYRKAGREAPHALALQNPLEISLMLRFTALLALIMLMSKLFSHGQSGLFTLGGISGLLDVDPITLSMARLTNTGEGPMIAAGTILIAAAANGLAKAVLGLVFGGMRLGLLLSGFAVLAFAGGSLVYLVAG